jgi:hypothetical protein
LRLIACWKIHRLAVSRGNGFFFGLQDVSGHHSTETNHDRIKTNAEHTSGYTKSEITISQWTNFIAVSCESSQQKKKQEAVGWGSIAA